MALRLHKAPDSDATIISAALNGDIAAKEALAEQWTPIVYRFTLRTVRNTEEAKDVTQETMVKILRHLDRFDQSRNFKAWVLKVARNTAIDRYRKNSRYVGYTSDDLMDENPSPLAIANHAQRAKILLNAVQDLPAKYRQVIVLYHFEHLNYAEISEVLNCPLGTTMNRIFRARKKLKVLYEKRAGCDG